MNEPWKADAWDEAAILLRGISDEQQQHAISKEKRRELAYISKVVASSLERKAEKMRGTK